MAFLNMLVGVSGIMVVFLFGSVGEIITEKSGHLNLGAPGIMCVGATGALLGVKLFAAISGGPEAVFNGEGIAFFSKVLKIDCALFRSGKGDKQSFYEDVEKINKEKLNEEENFKKFNKLKKYINF